MREGAALLEGHLKKHPDNPLAVIMKLFGKAVPAAQHAPVAPVDPSMTPEQEHTYKFAYTLP